MRAELVAHHALERTAVGTDEGDLTGRRRVEVDRGEEMAERLRMPRGEL